MNECKVPLQLFTKTIKGLNEKLHLLEMLIVNKCDKGQVKSAFSFLEKKLKQLILVVANNQTDQKDAMMTKQQAIKCLSCSHFVEKQCEKMQFNPWKSSKGNQLNTLLEMKNDFRNLKISQQKRKLPRKNPINSFYQKRSRPQSKSLALSNSRVVENPIKQ